MNKITPEVIAEMVRDIQRNEYHGELTITFNGGNVTLVKDSFTHKPDTIFDAYGDAATKQRKTVFVVNRSKKTAPETHEETEENKAG